MSIIRPLCSRTKIQTVFITSKFRPRVSTWKASNKVRAQAASYVGDAIDLVAMQRVREWIYCSCGISDTSKISWIMWVFTTLACLLYEMYRRMMGMTR